MANANIDLIRELISSSGLEEPTIIEQREGMERMTGALPLPDGVTVEPTTLAGRPAESITPAAGTGAHVVLYLHGGGYCIGSISTHRNLAARLALASGSRVVTLDYRLARFRELTGLNLTDPLQRMRCDLGLFLLGLLGE